MIDTVFLVVAVSIALAWLPILIRFTRSWRARNNPISLAICLLIVLMCYVPIYLTVTLPLSWPLATVITLDGIVCMTFYGAIHFAGRKFPDTRKPDDT